MGRKKAEVIFIVNPKQIGKLANAEIKKYNSKSRKGYYLSVDINKSDVIPSKRKDLKFRNNKIQRTIKLKGPYDDLTSDITRLNDFYFSNKKSIGSRKSYFSEYMGTPAKTVSRTKGVIKKPKIVVPKKKYKSINDIISYGRGEVKINNINNLTDNQMFGMNLQLLENISKKNMQMLLNVMAEEENMKKIGKKAVCDVYIKDYDGNTVVTLHTYKKTLKEVKQMLNKQGIKHRGILRYSDLAGIRNAGFQAESQGLRKNDILIGSVEVHYAIDVAKN